jgi:hypothetical protein
VVFACDLTSEVLGGEGRYEGATGTYEGTARTDTGRVTFKITVDLD